MFAVDPMLVRGVDLTGFGIVVAKVLVVFGFLLTAVMLMIWFERKVHADMSNRIGPNVAGPFGILQTAADGIKAFFKEDLIPDRADRFAFKLAPYLSLIPAFLTFSIVPLAGNFSGDNGGRVTIAGHETFVQIADPQIGILLMLAMSSIAVYGVMLAGWGSGSKYPLLGGVRATAQMVSYEAALGLSLLTVLLRSGSLSTNTIVTSQAGGGWNLWMTGLVPAVIFLIAATAEMHRPPFDLVEAEQELVGGFHTEYSGFRFAIFYLSEFMNVITMSGIIATLFLGGPSGPTFGLTGWFPDYVLGFVWFSVKVIVLLFVFVLFRTTLPRLRYDQLMDVGWKVLIPVALGWFMLLAALKVSKDRNWNLLVVGIVVLLVLLVLGALLRRTVRVAEHRHLVKGAG